MKRSLQTTQTSSSPDHRLVILKTPSIYPQILSLKTGYEMSPAPDSIIQNNMIANTLTISYQGTSIYWGSKVDLKTLKAPLHYLIQLGQQTVEVYPQNDPSSCSDCCMEVQQSDRKQSEKGIVSLKPPVGYELNKKCLATFQVKKRVDRNKLAQVCASNNCELIAMQEWERGCRFRVEIPHFTKYVFVTEENEEMENREKEDPETSFNMTYPQDQKKQIPKIIENSLPIYFLDKFLSSQAKNLSLSFESSHQQKINAVKSNLYRLQDHHFATKKPDHNLIKTILMSSHYHLNKQYGYSSGFQSCRGSRVYAGTVRTLSNCEFVYLQRKKESGFLIRSISSTYHTAIEDIKYVLTLQKQPNLISKAVLNQKLSMKIRQQLALFSICFKSFQSKFSFFKNKGKVDVKKQFGKVRKHHDFPFKQTSMLKDCFEWIIQEATSFINNPNNKYFQYLSKRKTDKLALQLIKYGQLNEAEFVANIEDIYYRQCEHPKLISELSFIERNELLQLPTFHRRMMEVQENVDDRKRKISIQYSSYPQLIKVAMIFWYQIEDMEQTYKGISNILGDKLESWEGYQTQWQILSIFFKSMSGLKKENGSGLEGIERSIRKQIAPSMLIWQWYFAQNLHKYTKIKNGPPPTLSYKLFRYNLLQKIIHYIYSHSDSYQQIFTTSIELLNLETFVEDSQKDKLIKDLTQKIVRNLMIKDDQKIQESNFSKLIQDISIFPVYSLDMMNVVIFEYMNYLNVSESADNYRLIRMLKMITGAIKACYLKLESSKKQVRHREEQKNKKYRKNIESLNQLIKLIFSSHLYFISMSPAQYRQISSITKELHSLYSKYQGPIFRCTTQQQQELAWKHEKYLKVFTFFIVIASKNEYVNIESHWVEDLLDFPNFFQSQLTRQFMLLRIREKLFAQKLESLDIAFGEEQQSKMEKESFFKKFKAVFGQQFMDRLTSVLN